MNLKTRAVAGITAASLAVGIVTTSLLVSPEVAAAYTVNFDEGSYSEWDGISYTFDWYENPTEVDGVLTYTIASASDLAGLSIITNNLSNERFSYITSNIAEEDKEYIALVDSFEDKVIKLDADINLADYDWMAIGYPWSTPALTASTEFINVNGETVTYNAVDYIPDQTVDPWVGDKNGNPISTRYWEYPEAELRFRDYTKAITQEATHTLIDVAKVPEYSLLGDTRNTTCNCVNIDIYDFNFLLAPVGYIDREYSTHDAYNFSDPKVKKDTGYDVYANVVLNPVIGVTQKGLDYSKDIAIPYTFKNIKDYTETKGFAGTFDGQKHKIKGLNPDTTWTEDTLERLTTYEPLARGLFSVLDEKGSVNNLAVKGSYNNEVVSYSALLCAYNYGAIDSCYVEGQMEQALIEQIYPVARDYDPDGSIYKLSDLAGAVMPSGNAGFMTSQNYGTIRNSYTSGEVTQAFRQFGFFASTNYGTIENCENYANFSCSEPTLDFQTDEWSKDGSILVRNQLPITYVGEELQDLIQLESIQSEGQLPFRYSHATTYNEYKGSTWAWSDFFLAAVTTAGANGSVDPDLNKLWIPSLYKTETAESIAANHLYGNYEITLSGGITALNFGSIENCVNTGNIEAIETITVCDNTLSVYDDSIITTLDDAKDIYNYIRTCNQYGIFSTALNGARYKGGISAINLGELVSCVNEGEITNPLPNNSSDLSIIKSSGVVREESIISAIAYTQNGYYQNDVKFVINGSTIYTPWGLRWWVSDTTVNSCLPDEYTSEYYDRNMPYPFYYIPEAYIYEISAGITGANANLIDGCTNLNMNTPFSVTYCSNKAISSIELPLIKNCKNSVTRFSKFLINTNTQDLDLKHALAQCVYQTENYAVVNKDIVLENDILVWEAIEGTEQGSLDFENIVVTFNDGSHIEAITSSCNYANFKDIYAESNLISRTNSNSVFTNVLINGYKDLTIEDKLNSDSVTYSGSIFGDPFEFLPNMQEVTRPISNVKVDNVYIVNSDYHALGRFIDSELQNIFVYSNGMAGLGDFENCSLTDIQVFGNDAFVYCDNCKINNLMSCGIISNKLIEKHKDDFIYQFVNSECTDMYLESDIDFEFSDPLMTGKIQHIPGVLKAYVDTNTFDRCAIVTPDGMLSYTSANILNTADDSIKTDAKLVYSKNAARNGALAYYLDHGDSDNRTYDFTVAFNDTVTFSDYVPSSIRGYISPSTMNELSQSVALPAYTRLKKTENEDSYYSIQVPYVSAGAGEIKVSTERNGETWSTNAMDNLFPKTELFAIPGETISFDVTAEEGFELIGMTWSTKSSNQKLESIKSSAEPYKFESAVMPAEDVVIESEWSNVWKIEVDEALVDWLQLNTSAQGAATGRTINLTFDVLDPNYEVGEIYYYPYVKNEDNDWIIDTSSKHVISIMDASFTMPASPIRIYAEALNGNAQLIDIVIAGEHGVIDEFNNVTVVINSSIDLTSLAVDAVVLSDNATISPAIDIPQDFTNPVEYIVKSESGKETKYLVQVVAAADGLITQFELKGRKGVIDQDNGIITVTLSETEDITNATAYVVWSGTDISPDPMIARNYTNSDVEFTITSSTGDAKTYKIIISRQSFSSAIEGLTLELNGEELAYEVNSTNKTIIVGYPYGADVSNVFLKDFAFAGANANLIPGQSLNLTIAHDVIIVDEAGNTETYTIMANEMINPHNEIVQFVLYGYAGVIDQDTDTITVSVPSKYDITSITPDAVAFIGKSIEDIDIRRDFTNPVTYTVVGFDNRERQYTVIVNQV